MQPLRPPLLSVSWRSTSETQLQLFFAASSYGLRNITPILVESFEPGRETIMSASRTQQIAIEESSDFQDRSITCVDCNESFIWTAGEQVFFHDKGLKNEPKRCKPCKQAKNDRLAAISAAQVSGVKQRIEVTVKCAQCGEQTTVPFFPSQGRPVYCRSCFLASRTMTASA